MIWLDTLENVSQLISLAAPYIRGLRKTNLYPLVSFKATAPDPTKELRVSLGNCSSLADFYDTLKRTLEANPEKSHISFLDANGANILNGFLDILPTLDHPARLHGKISLVTGGAQGFGEGIARELAVLGAHIIIADLNLQKAEALALELSTQYPQQKIIALKVDVSQENSVQELVEASTKILGGIDLLVSNAGVLKAGGLEDMSLADFEFVTKINYTAFFLMTKHATTPMKITWQADSAYSGDVVQINSKSGLEGSNRNFAYAGGKFGGIGLVQSFAKELVDYNIKVNAICPGNYYEGPLWSDPDRGLFVQYLKTGKVPGAKTVEDVYQSYVSKVPMKRGCSPKAVTVAIAYCIEQDYETGQAIPVTGGQNMLH